MLAKSLKISHTTKIEFFKLISSQSDQKIWQKYWHADWSGPLDTLTCLVSISVLIWGFLRIQITLLFAVYNFRNKSPLRLIFFCKVVQISCRLRKCKKKSTKKSWFWDNCIWIGCVRHSLLLRENACHRVSIC